MRLLSPDVEPLWVARYDYPPGWRLPAHVHHDYFQAIFVLGGAAQARIGGRALELRRDQLLFLRPGLEHGLANEGGEAVRTIDTKFRVQRRNLRARCCRLEPVRTGPGARLRGLFEALHAQARRSGPWAAALCQAILQQIILHLLAEVTLDAVAPPPPPESDASLRGRVRRYFNEHYAEKIDQRTLGAALNFSYRHISEVWRRDSPGTPLHALQRLRIEQAMRLIRYSDYELKQVAELTGFATVHHFTRAFTQAAGLPPGRWRERERRAVWQDFVLCPGFVNRVLTEPDPGRIDSVGG